MKYLSCVLLLCLISAKLDASCATGISEAQRKSAFESANKFEVSGSDWSAIKHYQLVIDSSCKVQDELAERAVKRAAALGKVNGDKYKATKKLYSSDVNQPAAFQWYELGGHFSAADDVLLEATNFASADLALFRFAFAHFESRSLAAFAQNNKTRTQLTGAYHADKSKKKLIKERALAKIAAWVAGFSRDEINVYLNDRETLHLKARAAEITQFKSVSGGAPVTSSELAEISRLEFELAKKWQHDPLAAFNKQVNQVGQWVTVINDSSATEDLVKDMHHLSVDMVEFVFYSSTVPEVLSLAFEMSQQMNDEVLVNRLRGHLDKLGQDSLDSGAWRLAEMYFSISENWNLADQARQLIEGSEPAPLQTMPVDIQNLQQLQKLFSDPKSLQLLQQQLSHPKRTEYNPGNAERVDGLLYESELQ